MMKPAALKNLFASLEDCTESIGRQKQESNMILGGQSDAGSHSPNVVQETTLTHNEDLDDLDAFQSRPKKICNVESSSNAMNPDIIQTKSDDVLGEHSWHPVNNKASNSVLEFGGVITSKFSFNHNPFHNSTSQPYTSPPGSSHMPDKDGNELCPLPSSSHHGSVMKCTTPHTTEDCPPGSYQNNRYHIGSPHVNSDSGIASPGSTDFGSISEKSPLPSSPYLQNVLSVDTLAPDTPGHGKLLSPNYQYSPNPNPNVMGNMSFKEVRNPHMDGNFLNTSYLNIPVSSGDGGRGAASPGSCPQLAPGILDSNEASMVSNSVSGSPWNETGERCNVSSNHQYNNKNSIPNNQNYQQFSSSTSTETQLKRNSPSSAQVQFSHQVNRQGRQKPQYCQDRQPFLAETKSNMQSSLEQELDRSSIQGFDLNMYTSPMQQTLNVQDHQFEAELTGSYNSPRQCLPFERAG